MFGDMRLRNQLIADAMPTCVRTSNRRDAVDLRLPIAKPDLFDRIHAFDSFISLEYEPNDPIVWPVAKLPGTPVVPEACSSRRPLPTDAESCVQSTAQDAILANNTACIAVAAAKEIGSQSTAP